MKSFLRIKFKYNSKHLVTIQAMLTMYVILITSACYRLNCVPYPQIHMLES